MLACVKAERAGRWVASHVTLDGENTVNLEVLNGPYSAPRLGGSGTNEVSAISWI